MEVGHFLCVSTGFVQVCRVPHIKVIVRSIDDSKWVMGMQECVIIGFAALAL